MCTYVVYVVTYLEDTTTSSLSIDIHYLSNPAIYGDSCEVLYYGTREVLK